MVSRLGRYGFVVPRFGPGCGGAENLAGALAKQLTARGDYVELLTTSARDNRTWENEYQPGETFEEGITVRRFPVDPRDLESWIPKQISISEGMNLAVDDQLEWMRQGVNSTPLYEYLVAAQERFDYIFFAPYLFGTTFYGSLLVPDKAVLIPCLHDEHYAYTDIVRSMFSIVGRAVFNCEPERELAQRLFGEVRGGSVGMGFDAPPVQEIESLTPYLGDSRPYLLYLGRKETGKGVQVLIDHFVEGKSAGALPPELTLVICGGGSFSDIERPAVLDRGDVIDIPHVTEAEKKRLIRYSTALCQPSVNESFSIVLMEAWQLGAPVIVNGKCEVTRYHAVESGGGLYYSDAQDFSAVVSELISDSGMRQELVLAGKAYVDSVYSWRSVLERFDSCIEQFGVRDPDAQFCPMLSEKL